MKRALTEFNKSVEAERTLRDEIIDLIEFISQYDWNQDYWVNKQQENQSVAEWCSFINDLVIKVVITKEDSKQKGKNLTILTSNDGILSNGFLYRMIITIVGNEEKSLIRELQGRFRGEQLLNNIDGISSAKIKLSDLHNFLLVRGKKDEEVNKVML